MHLKTHRHVAMLDCLHHRLLQPRDMLSNFSICVVLSQVVAAYWENELFSSVVQAEDGSFCAASGPLLLPKSCSPEQKDESIKMYDSVML